MQSSFNFVEIRSYKLNIFNSCKSDLLFELWFAHHCHVQAV